MRFKSLPLLVLCLIVALPIGGYAQEAVVSGTVTDSTGGVLPGVTVTAVHEASGNTFLAATDERGGFRLPVRTGTHRITAELSGFSTLNRTVELLVGQIAVVSLQLAPATLQESVTVTAEAPLLDTTNSTLTTNIDPRQMQELPLNGRNWVDLTLVAAGSRNNAASEVPSHNAGTALNFQLNLDGQQVTNTGTPSFGQPKFSADAIGEFEFVSTRFSATQGRSSGIQVNAVTKSGTNTAAGSFAGFFRNDRFNAADPVTGNVLPYSDSQLAGTFGGPILRDRFHYFAAYEYEREPQTYVYSTPYPSFNGSVTGVRLERKGLARFDFQFSPQMRLMARGSKYLNELPYDPRYSGGSDKTMGSLIGVDRRSEEVLVALTQVLGTRALNEIRVGKNFFDNDQYSHAINPNSFPGQRPGFGAPRVIFQGFTIGQTHDRTPQSLNQEVYSVRDDFTYTFNKGGNHTLRTGGEYLYHFYFELGCALCVGTLDLQGGPIPANIADYFPDPMDVSTWNLAPLSYLARSYIRTIATEASEWSRPSGHNGFLVYAPQHVFAGWVQDDWAATSRLTLNLGLRYDLFVGNYANWVPYPPLLEAGRPNDTNDLGPRLGFAYSLNERTVVRGGWGKYFSQMGDIPLLNTVRHAQQITPQVVNDGRPDFASNPFNGPDPTYDQAWARTCVNAPQLAGCLRPSATLMPASDAQTSYSYQASIGAQRQLGSVASIEADYVMTADRATIRSSHDFNLVYDPATGANYPFTDNTKKVYPAWGRMAGMNITNGKGNYHALQMGLTKRLSNRWQGSATYTLAGEWLFDPLPLNPGCEHPMTMNAAGSAVCDVPITLAPDISENDYYMTGAQRHRAVFNGIWEIGYGFRVSGLYLFGENGKDTPNSGVDVRRTGGAGVRLRADGTLIERNSLDRTAIHRVDLRLSRRVQFGSRFAIDGILEAFNVLNHANFNIWQLNERNATFGRPQQETNLAFAPRMVQLGFRATF